ncbi:hypothetical protein BaRGS_00019584 [Batillaria attramentaria]|uniref:Uncharacterized protein n=1 Tax=Batillaria attramentaria TaxID=370345 RepID=A0ABD0KPP2_9CAEN
MRQSHYGNRLSFTFSVAFGLKTTSATVASSSSASEKQDGRLTNKFVDSPLRHRWQSKMAHLNYNTTGGNAMSPGQPRQPRHSLTRRSVSLPYFQPSQAYTDQDDFPAYRRCCLTASPPPCCSSLASQASSSMMTRSALQVT